MSASAISRPMYPAPTITALLDATLLERAHQRERVTHRVQQVDAVAAAEAVKARDRWGDRNRAVPMISAS